MQKVEGSSPFFNGLDESPCSARGFRRLRREHAAGGVATEWQRSSLEGRVFLQVRPAIPGVTRTPCSRSCRCAALQLRGRVLHQRGRRSRLSGAADQRTPGPRRTQREVVRAGGAKECTEAAAAVDATMSHTTLIKFAPIYSLERHNDPKWNRPGRALYASNALRFAPGKTEVLSARQPRRRSPHRHCRPDLHDGLD